MKEPAVLHGYRRDLTKDVFEDLVALQCEIPEILHAVRQDGLIAIRRASFDQLKKSATIISQQYTRFLPPPPADDTASRAAIEALAAAVSLPEEEVREVFS